MTFLISTNPIVTISGVAPIITTGGTTPSIYIQDSTVDQKGASLLVVAPVRLTYLPLKIISQ